MRLLLIAALLPLGACQSNWEKNQTAQASGTGATRTYQVSGFEGVELRGPDDVDVKTGTTFSVSAEGDPKVLDQLDIRVEGGRLKIGRKEGQSNWSRSEGARIHVVMPRLTAATVSGSGDLRIDKAEGDFNGAVAGSGDLEIASLTATKANLSIAGSGELSVKGTAQSLSADIAGSGDIDAAGLRAGGAEVSVAGSGNVRAAVTGPAKVSIVGSGDVELTGGAQCQISAVGSGEARCS